MRRAVTGEAARLYCEATRRLARAFEKGAIDSNEYQRRLRAIGAWLDERGMAIALLDDSCGYVFIRNPCA